MYNIKTFNKISNAIYNRMVAGSYCVSDALANYDGVLVRSAKLHDETFSSDLKAIARAGAGTNNIPVDKCSENGIVVFNTPGANANAVKELVVATLLMSRRNLLEAVEWTKTLAGNGDQVPPMVEKGKGQFVGNEIKGKKLGVVGLGAIGAMVANAAVDLGMEVYGYDPYLSIKSAWSISRKVKNATSKQVLSECDIITYHVPLVESTRGSIDETAISHMKDGVVILNFSRAELANNEAVRQGLASGKIAKYYVDFPTEDMLGVPNCVCIPHLASGTEEAEENCAIMASEQMADYLETGSIKNSVNFPDMEVNNAAKNKVCVLHRNEPSVITNVTKVFGEDSINIEDLASSSKGKYSYMVIQTNTDVDDSLVNELNDIDNVLKVRIIRG